MNKVVKIAAALCIVLIAALYAGKNYLPILGEATRDDVLSIKKSNQSFSRDRYSFTPGEKVSIKLFNGLSDQDVVFYILNEGEDPTLVQHLKVQQGDLPEDYFYFKAKKAAPETEITIDFTTPEESGEYYFVGIGDLPMENLYGKFSIQEPQAERTTPEVQ